MKRISLAVVALIMLVHPAAVGAAPFTMLFEWQSGGPGDDPAWFTLTLESLGDPASLPADLAAEVTLTGPFELPSGFDAFCGQDPRVPGSSLAFCSGLLLTPGAGQDTVAALGSPVSALVTLLFSTGAGATTLEARLDSPGLALIDYPPPAIPIAEPATLVLLASGVSIVWDRRRRRGRC